MTGDLKKTLRNREGQYLAALKAGLTKSAETTKTRLRSDILGAGLSKRLSNTIQDDVFPQRGLAHEPSAIIYTKAPRILSLLADGGTVKPTDAQARLIPLPGSPAAAIRSARGIQNRGETLIKSFEQKYGRNALFKIERPGKTAILAMNMERSKASKFKAIGDLGVKRAGRSYKGQDFVTVPVFVLARETRHEKKIDARAIMRRGAKEHPAIVARSVRIALAKSNRETVVR